MSAQETRQVIRETVQFGGREIDAEALDALVTVSQGDPYLIRLAGDYAWRRDHEGRSTIADIRARTGKSDQYVQVYENRLIDSGDVRSAGRGHAEFSLRCSEQYIKTLIGPELEDDARPGDDWTEPPPLA